MGTHPIFESDFDCLTVRMKDFGHLNYGINPEVPEGRNVEWVNSLNGHGHQKTTDQAYKSYSEKTQNKSKIHYGDEYQDYKQAPVTEIGLPSNEHRNRPHGKVDGRNIKRDPTQKKFKPRPTVPDLNALRKKFSNEPWKAQMTQAWLQKADESLLEETYSWLNGDIPNCELAKVLFRPLKSSQLELENMTRDRDFEIDPEWRKQPWMKNFPKKYNLNK